MHTLQRFLAITVAGLLLFALMGCAKGRDQEFVGKWKVNFPTAGDKKDAQESAAIQSLSSAMSLELKPDKTFTMNMLTPMQGTWTSSGNSVVLSVTQEGGKPMDKTVNLELSSDGKSMQAKTDEGKDNGDVTFTKQG
jgi:hypothetical protein